VLLHQAPEPFGHLRRVVRPIGRTVQPHEEPIGATVDVKQPTIRDVHHCVAPSIRLLQWFRLRNQSCAAIIVALAYGLRNEPKRKFTKDLRKANRS